MKNAEGNYENLVRVYQPIFRGEHYSLYMIESSGYGRLFWIERMWEEDPVENINELYSLNEKPEKVNCCFDNFADACKAFHKIED